jgi:hypothetical protein
MPRRQRFKPSRKPKPAIVPSDQDVMLQQQSPPEEQNQEARTEQNENSDPR